MFTVADLQTLVGQVEVEGVICMISLSLKDEQTESDLARLCKRSVRYMRDNIFPLTELHNYTSTTGLFIKIIDRGRRIVQQLMTFFATSLGLQAPAASADTATPIGTQATMPLLDQVVRAARTDLSYIHDHDQQHDQIHDHEMNETARAAQRTELDRRHIKGQNRAAIESDPWCTAEVIAAAFQVARTNSEKPDPTGLAIWLLLKDKKRAYRSQIDAIAAELRESDQQPSCPAEHASVGHPSDDLSESENASEPEPAQPIFDESNFNGLKPSQIWKAAQGELQLQMNRATYDTWVKNTAVANWENDHLTISVQNHYTKEWWDQRLMTTATRIVTGIVGRPITISFTVWSKP